MRKFLACGLVLLATAVAAPAAFDRTTSSSTTSSVGGDAAATIRKAGGSLVYSYPQIGVVIASSDSPTFRADLLKNIEDRECVATDELRVAARRRSDWSAVAAAAVRRPADSPATDADTLSGLQWDMRQIHTQEAHAITGGSPSVARRRHRHRHRLHPSGPRGERRRRRQRQLRQRRPVPGTAAARTTTATARTRPGRSRRAATASGSSASRRT